MGVANWFDGLLDVFFPRSCVSCGRAVGAGAFRHLCAACGRRVVFAGPPRCETCGYPIFGAVESGRSCPHCLHLRPHYREGRTACLFQGPVRALLHALKYENAGYLARDLSVLAAGSPGFMEYLRDAILVPVPLHPRKFRERGYNQSELIARRLSALCEVPIPVENLLQRVADTQSQTRYSRKERQTNLKNAFALAGNVVIIPGSRYVLLDDVFTTGSTLNACAKVLRHSGVEHLDVATIGHG